MLERCRFTGWELLKNQGSVRQLPQGGSAGCAGCTQLHVTQQGMSGLQSSSRIELACRPTSLSPFGWQAARRRKTAGLLFPPQPSEAYSEASPQDPLASNSKSSLVPDVTSVPVARRRPALAHGTISTRSHTARQIDPIQKGPHQGACASESILDRPRARAATQSQVRPSRPGQAPCGLRRSADRICSTGGNLPEAPDHYQP